MNVFQLTPSRKATFFWRLEFWHVIISTHAFTEGDNSSVYGQAAMDISTHAFTEGDEMQARREKKRQNFNSRLHGRRHWNWLRRNWETYFNSRLHGRRLLLSNEHHVAWYFNSRLHGRRQRSTSFPARACSFQLTPSRKATFRPVPYPETGESFQLTPSRKATTDPERMLKC